MSARFFLGQFQKDFSTIKMEFIYETIVRDQNQPF